MSLLYIAAGIMGLGLLVVVHETGHLLAARASGMRVVRFSIGFDTKRDEVERAGAALARALRLVTRRPELGPEPEGAA